jgi:hypothetical protein
VALELADRASLGGVWRTRYDALAAEVADSPVSAR